MYIELHAASAFSFLDGASLPETLVERAAQLGYPALALLDRDGVYGAPRFHRAALAAGLRPIVGAELTIGVDQVNGGQSRLFRWPLSVLVETQEGYRNLCRLVTRMKLRAPTSPRQGSGGPPELQRRRKGEETLSLADFEGSTGGLVALAGRDLLSARHGVGGLLDRLVGLFGRSSLYVEVQRHLLRDEDLDNQRLIDLAAAFHVPIVVTNGVRFAGRDERALYDVLTCIRHKTDLAHAGRKLARNAERHLKSPAEMAALFEDLPAAVAATETLAQRLRYTMADLGYRFPEFPVPPGETASSFLRKMTDLGARERYRPYHDRARAQIARELDLIERLGLAGYFLIVWDIVNFCRQHDILAQGRGSAANSAVCYSLGITAVDPVGMDLLFERFLSEERGEWPDIDLDLPSGDRRECVIQHVYEKYGRHGAAMTANVITYRGRSAAREVGKVLGIEPARIDRLSSLLSHFAYVDERDTLTDRLREAGCDPNQPALRLFADLWQRIQDLPRHLGQHSGGMVICQGRLDEVVPLENASMPGRVVIQWDKEDCADMGIVKVDLLGLGMMAVLQDALGIINGQGHEPTVDLAHLPPDDPEVYRMLQAADTVGVFQVESRAQMATLPRMRPERFYDLVVEVAIIRPGPIVGQMVHPYLNRRAGREPVTYPHPSLEPILKRTLGVPLFQEQLLRMAMVAAGFTGGQAEELRRALGFKRSQERMARIATKLREGMARQGIVGEAADQVVKSIESFALYGFPESHAASFALLAYASAYLKVHFPAAFYAAMLNNQPMGFYHPATLVKDAQRRGVRFGCIDAQASDWLCTVEVDGTIRLGLRYVSGLREEVGRAIAQAKPAGGYVGPNFSSAADPNVGPNFSSAADPNVGPNFSSADPPAFCPHCGGDDPSMLEQVGPRVYFCNVCAHEVRTVGATEVAPYVLSVGPNFTAQHVGPNFSSAADPNVGPNFSSAADPNVGPNFSSAGQHVGPNFSSAERCRFKSVDDLVARTGARQDELQTLADIGALNSFGFNRREALWQVERAVRPAGELFQAAELEGLAEANPSEPQADRTCPLPPMTQMERLVADYAGTSLTIGPHPMAMRRSELAMRGVLRAIDLARSRHGRRIRVAGTVITRQRPGTAKGFVFLTLEDETGIANIIVRPDLYASERMTILEEPFLLVDGVLQLQEGVTSVRAERVQGLGGTPIEIGSHDFR